MPANQTFDLGTGTTDIDTILTQEANRINSDIYRRTMHVSPWIDLTRQTAFPDGMGYTLGTLIYDRSLPTLGGSGTTGTVLGVRWSEVGSNVATSIQTASTTDQILTGAMDSNLAAQNHKAFLNFTRQLKQYSLKRGIVESPRINIEDLRFAAYRTEQLRAVLDSLTEATRFSWEQRYRDEYDRVCGNVVLCRAGTGVTSSFFTGCVETLNAWLPAGAVNGQTNPFTGGTYAAAGGTATSNPTGTKLGASIDSSGSCIVNANISNKITDQIYFRLTRSGAGLNAYGRENARPIFAAVLSSEASYTLQTEAGFRDDVRYNNARVSDLIAPLGIEKSFRGFYHLIDDLAPRFEYNATLKSLVKIEPYTRSSATAAIIPNSAYESADYEALYILHQDVMESQIPNPMTGSNGLTFDPVNYRGKFLWKNIANEITNPDGTIGFFRGILASATRPIRTEFGYVVIFKRTATDVAV